MRLSLLTASLGALTVAALALPSQPPVGAAPAPADDAAGSTQSVPLDDLATPAPRASEPEPETVPGTRVMPVREVRRFSLLGVVWDDPNVQLGGRVQVRTRATASHDWSGWQDVRTDNDDLPDPASAERRKSGVRGSTAPLWTGASDAVQLRIVPDGSNRAPAPFPGGLRLELVDPGSARPAGPAAELRPLGRAQAQAEAQAEAQAAGARTNPVKTYIGPRPRIVTRAGWGADETLREPTPGFTGPVKAAFVHHTATGNDYSCADAPAAIRAIYRFHVKSSGWKDIGYNFLIDKCGVIYEGRAGGVSKSVMGAHTLGFNDDTTGIALLGTFTDTDPSKGSLEALSALTAWKLGLSGADPRGTVGLTSAGSNLFKKGEVAQLHVISGHRDGFRSACPGDRLYDKLDTARTDAARLQGR
ncbi:peptidoglycan recognition protein family protein [Streptomyces natalensis]|uniref:N-acetylmuramoyl-L-alanine amidase family protein n=1 Tax=Streptomyces natalensis ATCC 27448 TaxID=1240678 RepID=A0A0D7CUL1_9ACTN|nr:N-acetylmuramoyl-L-alanine amidase [Streptomyces natalensis]KIZ19082.1 N-acetylmuramoyl-L-alanine amidase family protein [Streptomyces natalensis ATCC 27448]